MHPPRRESANRIFRPSLAHGTHMSDRYITIFRSRLRPGVQEEYYALAERMKTLARSMPGFISIDSYQDGDGNRVSIVEFETHETAMAWRNHPEHREAQRKGREEFYEYYHGIVASIDREYGSRPGA